MLKKISITISVLIAVIILAGCPAPLESSLSPDKVIMLGVMNPAGGVTGITSALGGEIDVPVLITDQNGNKVTGNYDVTFTLDTDGDLETTADNIVIVTVPVSAGTESVVTLTVPGTAVAVTYNLFGSFVASTGDPSIKIGNEQLNLSCVDLAIEATNEVDLTISFVDPVSSLYQPGATFPLSFKIGNAGGKKLATGSSVLVRFEIAINGIDTEFGSTTLTLTKDLYPSDFITGTTIITTPSLTQIAADDGVPEADVTSWTGILTGTVDPDNAIVEVFEGGTDTFTFKSGTDKPDLRVVSITTTDYSIVGGAVELSFKIRNTGYAVATAGSYGLTLFHDVDTDGAFTSGTDTVINTWSGADALAVPVDYAGTGHNIILYTTSIVENLVFPDTMTAGNHQIGLIITGDIAEWSSTNNTRTELLTLIEEEVDLEITGISTTLTSTIAEASDGTIPLTIVIKNSGKVTLETDFTVAFYASNDNTLSVAGDILLGTTEVTENILAKKLIYVSYSGTLPGGSGAGYYTIYAVLDSAAIVTETDETNNQPSNAGEFPVYVVVDDGVENLNAKFLFCIPNNAPLGTVYSYVQFYIGLWNINNYFYPIGSTVGEVILSRNVTLIQGQDFGLRFIKPDDYYNSYLTFRLVPQYINDSQFNTSTIPTALAGEDRFEDNDTKATASQLSGSNNPLFGFVNTFLEYDDYDYYYFNF